MKAGLVEGLEIAGVDCHVPEVLVRRRFHKFLTKELDALFPPHEYSRLLAHPTKDHGLHVSSRLQECFAIDTKMDPEEKEKKKKKKKAVVAVGPEGGWTDEELSLLRDAHDFVPFSLGDRVLRTDVAVPCVMQLVQELFRD